MKAYIFVYKTPTERARGRKTRLKWVISATPLSALSDRHAVMKARRILRETRIDLDGGYCIGSAVALVAQDSKESFRSLRSTGLGLLTADISSVK